MKRLSFDGPGDAPQADIGGTFAWLNVRSRLAVSLARQNGRVTSDDAPTPDWTANHFSQSNPRGPGQDDVPALLRRVAETIASLGDAWIIDLVMHNEITAEGNWPSIVVYYQKGASKT